MKQGREVVRRYKQRRASFTSRSKQREGTGVRWLQELLWLVRGTGEDEWENTLLR